MISESMQLYIRIIYRTFQRIILRNNEIRSVFGSVFDEIIGNSINGLSKRHYIRKGYSLPAYIELQFTECIEDAAEAFIYKLCGKDNLDLSHKKFIREYFSSPTITSELSKLLEPGIEFFDLFQLAKDYSSFNSHNKITYDSEEILDAWKEFIRGFSLSSRSKPAFREFLRASYEEGSFLALTDIRGAIENVEKNIESLNKQENSLAGSIDVYENELTTYKKWAEDFLNEDDKRTIQ